MSAVNILNQGDRVTLVADGGIYELDGTLAAIRTKLVEIPHLRAAFGLRGVGDYIPYFASRFALAGSIGEILDALPRALETAAILSKHAYPDVPSTSHSGKISIIAWENGPAAWVLESGEPAARAVPFLNIGPTPGGEGADILAIATGGAVASEEEWNAYPTDRAALAILGAQRVEDVHDQAMGVAGGYFCGGFGEMLTITAKGATRTRLCEWPDVVGEKIDPHRSHELLEAH